jgi:hypothetical protein
LSEPLVAPPRLLPATLASLAVAALLLVTLVLPAEFGIDPLGTGQALGLMGLAEAPAAAALETQSVPLRVDAARFELAPFESVELKYRLEQGATMSFSWQASAATTFDLHAEPDGAPEGFAESFARGRSTGAAGTYRAEFSGIHGWFWENRAQAPLAVELNAAGFFSAATEYRDGWETKHTPPLAAEMTGAEGSGESP